MTPDQFAAALARTKLKARAAGAARRVRVDGLRNSTAAREATPPLSPEAVRVAVARIDREHKAVVGCPQDWCCITVCVPRGRDPDSAEARIKEIEDIEWRRAGLLID